MSAIQEKVNYIESRQLYKCELCGKLDSTVKDYANDFDAQTSVADYLEKISGESVNIADITRLCDECYEKINIPQEEEEERSVWQY